MADSLLHLADQTRTAFVSQCNSQDATAEVAVRLLHGEHLIVGAIGFDGFLDVELTAEPVAALAGLMVGRRLAFQQGSRAAAVTEAEMLRGAVLEPWPTSLGRLVRCNPNKENWRRWWNHKPRAWDNSRHACFVSHG